MTDHNEQERYRLEAENDKLRRESDALRDIVRAAQNLVDVVHYQQNTTTGGPFAESFDSLKAALRSWYQPNGTGR